MIKNSVYGIYFARCMNIFNSLLPQLVKYYVHTTRKINSIHAIFYHILSLSIHRAQQPRSGQPSDVFFVRSVVGKTSTICTDLAHPSPNFQRGGGQKVQNLASFKTPLNFHCTRLKMQQDTRIRWLPYVFDKFGKAGFTHPWESSISCDPPPKIPRENVLNGQ